MAGATGPLPLAGISSSAWEHPGDRAALAALQAIPGFDRVLRSIIGRFGETNLRMMMQANAIRVTSRQYSDIDDVLRRVCATFDVETPELYVSQSPVVNAGALGVDEPFIVLQSSLIEVLDTSGLEAVIGHEVGHVISEHALYRTMLNLLLTLSSSASPLIGSAMFPIMMALLEWNRKAELSCDRAGLLAVQDLDASLGALAAMAGGVRGRDNEINLDEFVAQSDAYLDVEGMASFYKVTSMLRRTHPFVMTRVAELRNWVTDGRYHAIIGGEYIMRGAEPRALAEIGEARSYYSDSAATVFENAEDKVVKTLNKFAKKLDSALGSMTNTDNYQ